MTFKAGFYELEREMIKEKGSLAYFSNDHPKLRKLRELAGVTNHANPVGKLNVNVKKIKELMQERDECSEEVGRAMKKSAAFIPQTIGTGYLSQKDLTLLAWHFEVLELELLAE